MLPDVSQKPPADHSTIRELMLREKNGQPLFERLFEIYLEETPALLQAVQEAFASRDLEACYDAIHQMKGSAAAMGASRLFALTEAALNLCRDDQVFKESGLADHLRTEADLYIQEARALLKR